MFVEHHHHDGDGHHHADGHDEHKYDRCHDIEMEAVTVNNEGIPLFFKGKYANTEKLKEQYLVILYCFVLLTRLKS